MTETYYTETPCARGHSAPRYASNNECVECICLNNEAYNKTQRARINARRRQRYAEDAAIKQRSVAKTKERYNNDAAYRERHRAYQRDYARRHGRRMKYGITLEEYARMCAAQEHGCIICGQPDERGLVIDHCHDGGQIRGLLCRLCNAGLGAFRDDRAVLARAIEYLEKHHGD